MPETRLIMGMPVTIAVVGDTGGAVTEAAFAAFEAVDQRFSPYKDDSEVSALNRREIAPGKMSAELAEVLRLADLTRAETRGFFDIRRPDGRIDPSGLVKGWAISRVARGISARGHRDFLVDAGGDVQVSGHNERGAPWRVGIRNPFDATQIVKVLAPGDAGVATSGAYVRGDHIYDPHARGAIRHPVASVTVIADDVYDADRFATAAFAMGEDGIAFIEARPDLEGYAISLNGVATMTSGFDRYLPP